ncbi:hypothetical protein NDU88_004547 [Pleurodeles waltl]|uniref:non-specific serine/threonine protein kinase n=1 Tax=Pleurodeles waltl TaxID=8319 RepID=A0AAV7QCC1_PLEWA|nr:hypothetical protein NDU88_004547 [Pleurodeles waltl]
METPAMSALQGLLLLKSPQKKQAVKRHLHKHNLKHRYEFLETLGKGTYGKVKKARERSGRVVAIKSIRKGMIKDEQDLVHIRREIEIMSSLNHPHITTIHEVFENSSKIVIVMEYASKGDLYDYINDRQRLTEQEARHFFRQIVSAVYYCHKNGIVHRDLKLENILLDENGNVKIADFGLSNLYQQDKYLQTYCGSPLYASPEIVNGRPYKGPEVDSWSLGVLLYILVHGNMPFDGQDYKHLVRQISSGEYRQPSKPSDACGLIRWMLMVNPERRATIEDIANHWWLNWGYKVPMGELESMRDNESTLATVAEWLRRSSRPLFENGSKVRCFLRQHMPGITLERQRSLKKSKKENDVIHTMLEGAMPSGTEGTTRSSLKRPKGILKKRGSVCESRVACRKEENLPLSSDASPVLPTKPLSHDAVQAPVPAMPKKGILKNSGKRESGYYSSPDRSESGDILDCEPSDSETPVFDAPDIPVPATKEMPLRRKGILKHNSKYSASSRSSQGPGTFGSLDELSFHCAPMSLYCNRPSTAISEDSILSTESFDQLDLPDRMPESPAMRGSISADNLLRLEEGEDFELRPRLWDMKCYQNRVGDSCFSLTDCENVTEVYKQALVINRKLS